ncbi:MAG: hypothetical protein AAF602_22650 [Myxococcota bacterium]
MTPRLLAVASSALLFGCDPLAYDERLDQNEADIADLLELVDTELAPLAERVATLEAQLATLETRLAASETTRPTVSVVEYALSDYLFLDETLATYAEVPFSPPGPGVLLAQLDASVTITDPGQVGIGLGRDGAFDAYVNLYGSAFTRATAGASFAYRTDGEVIELEILADYEPQGPFGTASVNGESTKLVLTFFPDPPG